MKSWHIFILVFIISMAITACAGIEENHNPIEGEESKEISDPALESLESARSLEDQGDSKAARSVYEDLVDDYPDSSLAAEAMYRIGKSFESEGRYDYAIDWYENLVDDHPDSDYAPEAQFQIGLCLEKEDKLLDAFEAYQALYEKYPGKGSLTEILNREYAIGKAFMEGRKRPFLFVPIRSGLGTAENIFRTILKNATFSKISPLAQYNLGRLLQVQGDYEGAVTEYNQVLTNYPGTEVIPLSVFNIGICYYEEALGADYDANEVNKAIQYLSRFIKRFPDDDNVEEAEEKIRELLDHKAEKAYLIAEYYNSENSPAGARLYYQEVIEKYPESGYARKAREKLQSLPEESDLEDTENQDEGVEMEGIIREDFSESD